MGIIKHQSASIPFAPPPRAPFPVVTSSSHSLQNRDPNHPRCVTLSFLPSPWAAWHMPSSPPLSSPTRLQSAPAPAPASPATPALFVTSTSMAVSLPTTVSLPSSWLPTLRTTLSSLAPLLVRVPTSLVPTTTLATAVSSSALLPVTL